MKKLLKVVAVVVVVLVASLAAVLGAAMAGKAPIVEGQRAEGVEVVKDGYVDACIVDVGKGRVALVDAGDAEDAGPLLAALKRRGLGPEAVQAILLTHGDFDHTRGARHFPQATVMMLEPDVALAEGRVSRTPMRSPKPMGFKVGRVLQDGEVVEVGEVRFEVFAVPGHTPGSAAYLARGVLFLGDSADVSSDGKLEPGNWLFSQDTRLNRRSLRELAARLEKRAADVKVLLPSHSGALEKGLAPLTELAAALRD
ncbi:MAG TPA: MBL fold metallo-hydrolase [Myxococcales bacterium]|jgi:glyoxylase-like metal-dependent hydrolase (beta-lactamase superfamily II)